MEKTFDFLKNRSAAQLAALLDVLASDLHYEVTEHLKDLKPDSDEVTITRHDCSLLTCLSLCQSITSVVVELNSLFE